ERFHRFVLGQTEAVIYIRGLPVAIFCTLPEFPFVISGEWSPVFLGLMHKYSCTLTNHFIWTQWNGHFNLIDAPFVPGTTVQPQPAILKPGFALQFFTCHQNSIQTNFVRTMGIRQVAGCINLMRFDFLQQFPNNLHICFTYRILDDFPRLIKRQIQKMDVVISSSCNSSAGTGLPSPDHPFDTPDHIDVWLTPFF